MSSKEGSLVPVEVVASIAGLAVSLWASRDKGRLWNERLF